MRWVLMLVLACGCTARTPKSEIRDPNTGRVEEPVEGTADDVAELQADQRARTLAESVRRSIERKSNFTNGGRN